MDLISAFKSELFRPLTTIIVPGAFAVGPWWLIAMAKDLDIANFTTDFSGAFAFVFIAFATAAGFVLENIGARIEGQWDAKLENRRSGHNQKWREYLQLETKDEIVGQRYLNTIVTRMKFELAFGPALIVAASGMWYYNSIMSSWSWPSFAIYFSVTLVLAVYLLYESWESASTAAATRDQILVGVAAKYSRTAASAAAPQKGTPTPAAQGGEPPAPL